MNPSYQEFKFPQIRAHPWSTILKPTTPPDCIDLISKLLVYVPTARFKSIEVTEPLFYFNINLLTSFPSIFFICSRADIDFLMSCVIRAPPCRTDRRCSPSCSSSPPRRCLCHLKCGASSLLRMSRRIDIYPHSHSLLRPPRLLRLLLVLLLPLLLLLLGRVYWAPGTRSSPI